MSTTLAAALTESKRAAAAPQVDSAITIAAGIELAGMGFHILPIIPGQKRPPFKTGPGHSERASQDPEEIAAWFEHRPDWELGLVLHLSRNIAIDVDIRRSDPRVAERMVALEQKSGYPFTHRWSDATACQVTPKHGWHYLWKLPTGVEKGDLKSQLAKGVELQQNILVVAPSHGRRWIRHPHQGIATFPDALVDIGRKPPPKPITVRRALSRGSSNIAGLIRTVENAKPGERNRTLYWAACRVRDRLDEGANIPDAEDQLAIAALNLGMPIDEALKTIASALEKKC